MYVHTSLDTTHSASCLLTEYIQKNSEAATRSKKKQSLFGFLSLSSVVGASDEDNLASVNNRD